MIRPALFAALALGLAPSANAQTDYDVSVLASRLGTMLASEQICGLDYDQQAISGFIDANVTGAALGFASELRANTGLAGYDLDEMTDSARTAHCRSVENTARHLGFIE